MKVLFFSICLLFCFVLIVLSKNSVHSSTQENSGINISLKSSTGSNIIKQGDLVKLTAQIIGGDETLHEEDIKRYLMVSARITQPDGTGFSKALFDNGEGGDQIASDGIYSSQFIAGQAGDYIIQITAEGKGFKKTEIHTVKSLPISTPSVEKSQTVNKNIQAEGLKQNLSSDRGLWTIFIIANMTAAFIWIAGFGFLIYRFRRSASSKNKSTSTNFCSFIRSSAEDTMKQINTEIKLDGEVTSAVAVNDLHETQVNFLKGIAKCADSTKDNINALWKDIFDSFNEPVKKLLKERLDALDEIRSLKERLDEIEQLSDNLKDAQKLAGEQAKRIAFLMSFKEVFSEAQQRLDMFKKKNMELQEKLTEAFLKTGSEKDMLRLHEDFIKNIKELELCVATLESENERLTKEVNKWQQQLQQSVKDKSFISDDTVSEVNIDSLQETIKKLEAIIREKDMELSEAAKKYDSLEAEYMVLYQEKQQSSKQPDIP